MFLELIQPSQELAEEVTAVLNIQGPKPEDILAERGRLLRDILAKWHGKVSQGYAKQIRDIVDLTIEDDPEVPQVPNAKAFNSANANQMDEYKILVAKAFNDLRDHYENRKKVMNRPAVMQTPLNRAMMTTDMIRQIRQKLIPKSSWKLRLGKNDYIFRDDGEWPGHSVVKLFQENVLQAKNMVTKIYCADMIALKFWAELPEHVPALEQSEDNLADFDINSIRAIAKGLGIKWTKTTKKPELLEAIVEAREKLKGNVNDSEKSVGPVPDETSGSVS